jgi:translation initiation factor 2 alpha subunit (eIF-2alpha)
MYHYNDQNPKLNTYCFFKLSTSRRIRSDDLGVEVNLLDYNNLEAFIPITEINRKKFNIQTYFKPDIIYPGIIYLIENGKINVSYSKIKEEKREKLLKNFDIQTKFANLFNRIKNRFSESDIFNPIDIDFSDGNYADLEKLYKDTLINPEKITSDNEIQKFIIENRKLVKPIYEQQFTLTVLESNGVEILKSILNEINKHYRLKIISSPLYTIEFENLDLHQEIKDKLEESIINVECIFEITEFNISKELQVEFD